MKVNWPATTAKYKGRWCVGGIDLSSVSDLTCWVMAFPDIDDPELIDILMRVWCPEAKLHDAKNKYRDQYQGWNEQGFLETTDGDAMDYDYVRAQVVNDAKSFDVRGIALDMLFQGYEFAQKLNIELGKSKEKPVVFGCGMSFKYMGGPCQELERRLIDKKINHGGNPVLRFMADNVSVRESPEGFKRPDKASSQGKIDGIVGILLCLDRLLRQEPPKKSVYVDRGPIFI